MLSIETIDDVRRWVKKHPNHIITAAWKDMLSDMDELGEDYNINAFFDEAYCQMSDHVSGLCPNEVKDE
jgi:hypothetical protein